MILNKFLFVYYIFLAGLYALSVIGYLIKPLNPVQKALTKIFRSKPLYSYIIWTYSIISIIICALWFQTESSLKTDKEHIEIHQDKTSFDYIDDKQDIFRNERNLYLYAGAFFVTLANLRYLSLTHDYYLSLDRTEQAKKSLKQQ